jgi:hypothetical protein
MVITFLPHQLFSWAFVMFTFIFWTIILLENKQIIVDFFSCVLCVFLLTNLNVHLGLP